MTRPGHGSWDDSASIRRIARRGSVLAVALLALALGAAEATASTYTYQYSGTITAADPSSGVAPGTAFSGTFTYDPADRSQELAFEGYHSYLFGNMGLNPSPNLPYDSGMTLSVGGQPVGSMPGGLGLSIFETKMAFPPSEAAPIQNLTELTIRSLPSTGGNPLSVVLDLNNLGQTIYPTLDLPSSINLSDFPTATITVNGGSGMLYSGTIDGLQIVPTPEPTPALVFAAGLVGWLVRSRSRARRLA